MTTPRLPSELLPLVAARPGVVVRVTTTPWARLVVLPTDGEPTETRADGHGDAVLTGLPPGVLRLVAHDRRRSRCSAVATLDPAAGDAVVDLPATVPTARLLVTVRGGDRRPVLARSVSVTDAAGRTVTARVVHGLADVGDLRPGPVRVTVPPSLGHRGTTVEADLGPGALATAEAVVPVGATVAGRVVQGRQQYAAVVALLDEDGREVERVRTAPDGRFEIGTGLGSRSGLTLVATTGPETLHVTRAAVADVAVVSGVRHHLGDVVLPVAGRRAVWTVRTPAEAGTRRPSPRV
jgi:hypothetical protein